MFIQQCLCRFRSNNFYFALLLIMLFLCTLPVGYAIVWLEPSWHCGPFSGYLRAYKIFTNGLQRALPDSLNKVWLKGVVRCPSGMVRCT